MLTLLASCTLDSFTGAYVFYWLLLLLLYMSAYFLATKSEDSNSSDYSAGAQVVRQLVAFLISSKGYLDYVIWFAVNNIEKYAQQCAKTRVACCKGTHTYRVNAGNRPEMATSPPMSTST